MINSTNTKNTKKPEGLLKNSLGNMPVKFKDRICADYLELKKRYARSQFDLAWDTSGLSVGKFCESVLRFLQHVLTGDNIPFGKHIPNFPDECRKLIQLESTAGLESLRIIIPRGLVYLYTIRGKRGIGHVGGDVDANEIDAAVIVRVCDWIIAELIRIYHKLSLEEAQAIVDSVAERTVPMVWEIGGKKRVLRPELSYSDKTLLLLYTAVESGILVEDLFDWVEHSSKTDFKRRVLKGLHDAKYIEWDVDNDITYLSPRGIDFIEKQLLRQAGSRFGGSLTCQKGD